MIHLINIILIITAISDILSTKMFYNRGLKELNPVVAFILKTTGNIGFIIFKALVTIFIIWISYTTNNIIGSFIISIIFGICTINNLIICYKFDNMTDYEKSQL